MQGKEFKYYITDEFNNYYVSDNFGKVTKTTTPTELRFAPKEWENIKVKHKRALTNLGVLKDFTTNLQFVKDGADILRFLYAINGGETKAYFLIHQINHNTNTLDVYQEIVRCMFDFPSFRTDRHYVNINLIDRDLDGALRAQYDTLYEWEMWDKDTNTYDPDLVDFAIHELNAYESSSFIVQTRTMAAPERVAELQMDLSYQSNNSGMPVVVNNPYEIIQSGTTAALLATDPNNWFLSNNLAVMQWVEIIGDVTIEISGNWTGVTPVIIEIYDNTGTPVASFTTSPIYPGVIFGVPTQITIPITSSFTVNPNAKLFFVLRVMGGGLGFLPFPKTLRVLPSNIEFKYKKATTNTLHKGYMLNTIFRKLVEKVTNGFGNSIDGDLAQYSDQLTSPMYGKPAHILTSGQMLRKAGNKVYFKTSMKLFQQYIKTAYGMDIAIEEDPMNNAIQKLTCRHLTKLFDANLNIGSPQKGKDLRIEHAREMQVKLLNIGWRSQNSEQTATGYTEYNVRNEYGNKSARELGKVEITSDYYVDLTTLEKWRNNNNQADEGSDDNQVCVFSCIANTAVVNIPNLPAPYVPPYIPPYVLQRNTSGIVSGAYDNSVYNVFFTPKRCAWRNKEYIAAHFALYSSPEFYTLVLNNTSKTSALVTNNYFAGEGIVNERTDIDTSQHNPLFKPYFIHMTIAEQEKILYYIYGNKFGYLFISFNGRPFYGFIWEIDYMADLRKECELILLAHPYDTPYVLPGMH